MKILVLSDLWPPYYLGGYELAAANVSRALVERGHDILVATTPSHIVGPPDPPYVRRCMRLDWFQPYKQNNNDHESLAVYRSATGDAHHAHTLLALLREFEPDLVYVWNTFAMGGLGVLDVLDVVGVPWVLHLMDKQPEFIFRNMPELVRPLFGRVSGATLRRTNVIAMSEHLLDEIAQDTGITFDSEVDIVPGWVNTKGLSRRTEYLQDGVARFVTAGAVVPHKGIGLIIDAAAQLVARGVEAFMIDVYGEGQIAFFVEQANALGVQGKIRFLGGRSQAALLAAYPTYDAFLFPTWEREPFGFAPIEAAACGCVPIMTRNCGASERVLDKVHCIKIERDVGELANAMLDMIEGRVDLPALGQAGAQLVHSDLSLDKMIGQIERALEKAATGWDVEKARDPRLSLLFHVKQDLAIAMARGYAT